MFEIEIAAVYLSQDDDSVLKPAASSERARNVFDHEIPKEGAEESPISRAYKDRDSIWIADISNAGETQEYEPVQSVLCLPLGEHGVFVIGSTELDALGHSDREELELLGTNTATALTRTDREKRLRKAHEHRSKLFDNSTDCVVEIAFDGRTPCIEDVNPAFESVFGYDASDVRGKSLKHLIVPPELETESDEIIDRFRRGDPFETEVRRDTVDGRRDFLFRSIPMENGGEVIGGYAVYTDITERRRQEQQVQVLNRILRHNLRNKVNVIHGQAVRVQDQVGGETADAVAEIVEAAEDLMDLSEKTTQLRRANQQDGTSDDVNLVPLIEEVAAEIRDDYDGASIIIDGPERAEVVGGALVKIAFYEVFENAIKHTETPESEVFVDIQKAAPSERWTEITVTDDGPGIPDMEQEVLGAGLETPLQHGSGLGLWVVNWIVKSLGGEFTIETSDEQGARLRFKLPKRNVEPAGDNGSLFDKPEW